ncbi:aminotransferase class V-fold PLP-dependent enzyme [bacterium]|nr:aminotransferase class V-fold PLP-dependent enzyme [bacterium]NUN45831.1 aminotransferase class V-fold PLP-dependent enzyme [bacterium]
MKLEEYFQKFRTNTIGHDLTVQTPYGTQHIVYADWVASGRLYRPIEEQLLSRFGPYVANTHTETTTTGTTMTHAYHEAKAIIKGHVNAAPNDVLIFAGSGMTGAVAKFQRILNLRIPEKFSGRISVPEAERPVIFVTHMEHHSNHTSWLETIADVELVGRDEKGLVDLNDLSRLLERYKNRPMKIASVTACSNVTGIQTPYHDIAKIMHQNGGYCFVDFACSAPYVPINMHPADTDARLDAIYFSPHKFLGGPGTPGVLIFNAQLYGNKIPDQPGGGTVTWTNPWGEHKYFQDIEIREDGGTPPFLQAIKAAMAIRLKETMDPSRMMAREEEMLPRVFQVLRQAPGLHILADHVEHRLGIISFYIDGLHYNLGVKLLNDRFGIQVRGGCSCAGTYGHYLLNVTREFSKRITDEIDHGDMSEKPGWIRLSLHPVMTDQEVDFILRAISDVASHHKTWSKGYVYDGSANEFRHKEFKENSAAITDWFRVEA